MIDDYLSLSFSPFSILNPVRSICRKTCSLEVTQWPTYVVGNDRATSMRVPKKRSRRKCESAEGRGRNLRRKGYLASYFSLSLYNAPATKARSESVKLGLESCLNQWYLLINSDSQIWLIDGLCHYWVTEICPLIQLTVSPIPDSDTASLLRWKVESGV